MKLIHNSDFYQSKKEFHVMCAKYQKDATLTVFYKHRKLCKTDIQLTPVELGMQCSLWDGNNSRCIECPHKLKRNTI